jgi:hypothetical protein
MLFNDQWIRLGALSVGLNDFHSVTIEGEVERWFAIHRNDAEAVTAVGFDIDDSQRSLRPTDIPSSAVD